ncbi:MAG: hypothetical protein AB2L14_25290 [Candidatus Xenobiia bacterium LiM19]
MTEGCDELRTIEVKIAGRKFTLTELTGPEFMLFDQLWPYYRGLLKKEAATLEEKLVDTQELTETWFRVHEIILPDLKRGWWNDHFKTDTLSEFIEAELKQIELNRDDSGNPQALPAEQ